MAGISDSGQPDDVRIHLEVAANADGALATAPEGESDAGRAARESQRLPRRLRERLDKVLADVQSQVPGLSAAQLVKLEASRAGRDALKGGIAALARVDSHLQSRTGERNPAIGRKYGVFGANPTTFGGVARALAMSSAEDARLAALPAESSEREELQFTPVIAAAVSAALGEVNGILAQMTSSRADLSRAVSLKDSTLGEARAVLTAIREHLYANLPNRRLDDDLRDYGFRPVALGVGKRRDDDTDPNLPTA